MEKLDMLSKDVLKDKRERLKELFPEAVTEGKIDCEKLQILLGEDIETDPERYNFTWKGKNEAIRLTQLRSTGTLRPCKEESKDWDKTKNLYIEGDNLEVLRLLQDAYFNKVKMIYIDPPYNTGNDFVYKDDFKDNLGNYKRLTEQRASNPETSGRYHTDWLNMMYPRLRLAKNLLRDDGVIFISIDDNEMDNIKKLCGEIFGEGNFIALLPTIMNLKGNNDQFGFAGTHEFTLVYSKNRNLVSLGYLPIDKKEKDDWKKDLFGYYKKGANLKATGTNAPREKRPNLFFPIYVSLDGKIYTIRKNNEDKEIYPITDGKEMSWRWSKNKFDKEKHNIILIRNENNLAIYKKTRPPGNENNPSKKPKTLFYKPEYSSGNGTNEIKGLFRNKVFLNPKPTALIDDFLKIGLYPKQDSYIILDFFSGSATTAHAVMQLNAEDNGNRQFIMVQLPELCDEKSEAYNAGYKTISDIGKERIRRAGEKIKEENKDKEGIEDLDIGFKVFKLDTSNLKVWNPIKDGEQTTINDVIMAVNEHIEVILPDRSPEDLLYEILLKYKIELTTPVKEISLNNKRCFDIGYGYLLICLDEGIDMKTIEAICEYKTYLISEYDTEDIMKRVVFIEEVFTDDNVKINCLQTLKNMGIDDVKVI